MLKYQIILLCALCWAVPAWAADSQAAEQEPVVEQTGTDSDQQGDEAASEDTTQEEGEETDARFIPTEEISQDLGVSFPVDI